MRRTPAGLAVAAALLGSWSTVAPSARAQLFDEAVEVRVVNIDVHVTDKKGRPVTGLTAEDFELYIDGQPATISYFYATEGGETRSAALDAPAAEPPDLTDRRTAYREAENLLVVLYLDHNWLRLHDRARLLDDLEGFVAAQGSAATRFLVVTGDPGLHVRSPITTNLETVRTSVATLAEMPTHGDDAARDRHGVFRDIQSIWESYTNNPFCTPCDCGWGQMLGAWEAFAQRVTHRMRVSTDSLSDLLAALGGIPGRKAVLYVAGGLEQRPALDVLQFLAELCPRNERDAQARFAEYDESSPLLKLGAQANASRATFYPLDSGGARTEGSATVEWDNNQFRPSGLVTRIERENYHASLQILASETGGRAIFNANQPLERLRDLESDFEFVYSLGFEPDYPAGGRSHQVKVRLKNPKRGVELRFRRAYIDRPLDRKLVYRAVAAITFGEEHNPLAVEAEFGETTELARNAISLPVHIAVRPEHLTLLPGTEGGRTGRFRVFLAARSRDGSRTTLRERFFDVTPEEIAEGIFRLIVRMNLEKDDYTVGVGVRDEIGHETSYLTLDTTDPSDRAEVTAAES